MSPHTRAIVAAAAYAFMFGKKVAGGHDHASGRDLQIAAETQGDRLQGFDGDRQAKFNGTPSELYDAGDKAFISLEIDGLRGGIRSPLLKPLFPLGDRAGRATVRSLGRVLVRFQHSGHLTPTKCTFAIRCCCRKVVFVHIPEHVDKRLRGVGSIVAV
jgi:hypothetical protein